jgi:hypothetical protein
MAQEANATLRIILCLAEQDVRNERVALRDRKYSQPIGVSKTKGDGRVRYLHLPESALLLSTEEPQTTVLKRAIAYLIPSEEVEADY